MKKEILTSKEIVERTAVDPSFIQTLIDRKLIKPVGKAAENVHLFEKTAAERISQISQFLAMGYSIDDVEKILKKVGPPSREKVKDTKARRVEFITVGELANRLNVNPRTIKYWEERGIIEPDTRSAGGFRLYADHWIYLCKLIKDLQLFGYSLEDIKDISDLFRDFLAIKDSLQAFSPSQTRLKLKKMREEISLFYEKMNEFKEGIDRWEELLKKKEKDILHFEHKLEPPKASQAKKRKKS